MLGLRSTRGVAALVDGVGSAVESATEGAVCHESDVRDVWEDKRGCGGAFGAFALAIAERVAQTRGRRAMVQTQSSKMSPLMAMGKLPGD
jgi:hypothetical protein